MSVNRNRIIIVGATSRIAEYCARLWLEQAPADLVLIARNQEKVQKIAADLEVRSPASTITVLETDFTDPKKIQELADKLASENPIHIALIAHGSLADQKECETDLSKAEESLLINGVSPVLFAEAFAGHMEKQNFGSLAIIGSVAGDRGRKTNYIYGAGKGLVEKYAQGLQHRLAATGVKVSLIKPGPTDTPMTAQIKEQGKGRGLADPQDVAKAIIAGVQKGKATIYAPPKWALIMLIIRFMPNFIFNKLNI